ncbi:MAG: M20/M25/M40 family metallo-hydrolase [Bacteroidetes bacterium]|nr:MAG: M20/M25/M40 family metallo-hydrolase [Bacteroidota bacterium]
MVNFSGLTLLNPVLMKRIITLLLVTFFALGQAVQAQTGVSPEVLKKHVEFLASDSLKGRKPGTPEAGVAARYILENFIKAGLTPLADNGFQSFYVVTGVDLGGDNLFTFDGTGYKLKADFIPLAFSSSGQVEAPVVFAGFGFDLELDSLKWNDYEGIDANGRWVMVFRADPEPDNSESAFIPFSDLRSKILTAKDKGAAGVLLVTPRSMEKDDQLMPLVVENNEVTAGIPAIHITRALADQLLQQTGYTVDSLDALIIKQKKPLSFELPGKLVTHTEVIQEKDQTVNVVGLLKGSDPVLSEEYLVVGGHYDHLGMGGPNSGSRMPDTNAIHNGADDNASGTAMVMELARVLAAQPPPARSIIFVAFSAEEMGLLGSRYFVNNPPVPAGSIKTMFNFDMVGRFDKEKNSISVSGTGTSAEADSILRVYEETLPFQVVHAPDGYGPSDHASFYSVNIPVFYFNTGVHMDYHTPFDDADKLDYVSEAEIGDFAVNLIQAVAGAPKPLAFRESGSKAAAGRTGRKLKVTLGIMPDFAGSEKRGLRVDGVTVGKPADLGGMLKGDIIVSINGLKVENIYEYMSRLSKLKHGQTINVEVIRGDKQEVLLIQL